MSFISTASRSSHLSVVEASPGLRLIAYIYYPRERQPRRQVLYVATLDEGRSLIRQMFADHVEARAAELWEEDWLIARLRAASAPD